MSDWQDELSTDDLKTNATLRNFETPEAAYQGLIDLKAKQGNMIRLSSEDAGDEERASNRDKIMKAHPDLMMRPDYTDDASTKDYLAYIGVPEKESGYESPETTLSDELIEEIRKSALAEELTPRQFNKRVELLTELHTEQAQAQIDAIKEEKTALETQWGSAHEDRMKQVSWVAKEFFSEFGELGEMNNIAIQGLYKIAQQLQGKGAQAHAQPNEPVTGYTPEEAQDRVDEIRAKIIENKYPAKKAELTKKMIEMQKMTNPAAYA